MRPDDTAAPDDRLRLDEPIDEPLRLPTPPAPAPRPPLPLLTAVVPVVGALVLWQVTGSVFALWFAALGPLMAAASLLDGLRGRRRARRTAQRETTAALERAAASLSHRHETERRSRWLRHPDVAGHARDGDGIWRPVPGRADTLVVGRGSDSSAVRVSGGDDAPPSRELRRRAQRLDDVPVTVPLAAGVAVVGPATVATAIVRALAVQVCLTHPPGTVRALDESELCPDALPHLRAGSGLSLYAGTGLRGLPAAVDIPLVHVPAGSPPPPRCAAVLTVTGVDTARLDHGGSSSEVRFEAVSAVQAARIAEALQTRSTTLAGRADAPAALAALLEHAPPAAPTALAAPIGVSAGKPAVLDLVADGPHAIVIGVTGSGKSELLTSWVVALCAAHTPAEATFLLVDFKGGRTFDALTGLPHVTGVLTDLDETAALRAVESLRAEIRHRERVLADADAREISEAGGALPRLVIVVDEYAALVAAHPTLHDLFGDIAARGRALGLHLILASQRAAGVFRDAVLANAPLRISLRVADAGDSRAVLGTDEAVMLPGSADAVGTALVRRAADSAARTVRVARCTGETIAAIAAAHDGARARRPWLPALPDHLPLGRLRTPDTIVLGLADEPDRQQQPPVALTAGEPGFTVIGQAGSGRTTVLRTVAAQAPAVHWVAGTLEQAWDRLGEITGLTRGTAVLVDNADALVAALPGDYASEAVARLERVAREARSRGILLVLSVQRPGGAAARVAELLPRRLLLALPSRADHVAAGGDGRDFLLDAPPGRGRWGRTLLQVADPGDVAAAPGADAVTGWYPGRRPTAFVSPGGVATREVLRAWRAAGIPVAHLDDAVAGANPELVPGTVLWGTPDAWLAQWRLLSTARTAADLLVDTACSGEYRQVTGHRDLPPFAIAGAGRAWLHRADRDATARRVLLPGPTGTEPLSDRD